MEHRCETCAYFFEKLKFCDNHLVYVYPENICREYEPKETNPKKEGAE